MVEAATEFRKNSFSDEDSATLALVATTYQNVADEAISAGDSASFLIAMMKAFNVEAKDAESIIDSVNEVKILTSINRVNCWEAKLEIIC